MITVAGRALPPHPPVILPPPPVVPVVVSAARDCIPPSRVLAATPAAEAIAPVRACLRLSAAETYVQYCFRCCSWFTFRYNRQ